MQHWQKAPVLTGPLSLSGRFSLGRGSACEQLLCTMAPQLGCICICFHFTEVEVGTEWLRHFHGSHSWGLALVSGYPPNL